MKTPRRLARDNEPVVGQQQYVDSINAILVQRREGELSMLKVRPETLEASGLTLEGQPVWFDTEQELDRLEGFFIEEGGEKPREVGGWVMPEGIAEKHRHLYNAMREKTKDAKEALILTAEVLNKQGREPGK